MQQGKGEMYLIHLTQASHTLLEVMYSEEQLGSYILYIDIP